MTDSLLALAFALHSGEGVYALLLGSGLSRSTGIPTGHEITLDLIRKMAALRKEDCEPDPIAWYRTAFGTAPDYARLLDSLTVSSTERFNLLRRYFEPQEEDRSLGLKVPTAAHRSIAELVSNGVVRFIVTTNFDRLIEKALEDAGVVPIVISTPEAAQGSVPLMHQRCVVIKVHGDYLDTRIKNTATELSDYDDRMSVLLDRVLDECGLIVCGWSAEYDTALRAAIERCPNHRFATCWALKDPPTEEAARLIRLRRARELIIKDADSFFVELATAVTALRDHSAPHPHSAKMAVATAKRYLSDTRFRIALNDLIHRETERVCERLSREQFLASGPKPDGVTIPKRVSQYEALVNALQSLVIAGCYWGTRDHDQLWTRSLERISNCRHGGGGFDVWLKLQQYPALVLLYAGGLATVAAKRDDLLGTLLIRPEVRVNGDRFPLILAVNCGPRTMEKRVASNLPGMETRRTPLSDHLFTALREPLRDLLPDDADYEEAFDRFEYLSALVYAYLYETKYGKIDTPLGRFAWRIDPTSDWSISKQIDREIDAQAEGWPLLQFGLFDRTVGKLRDVKLRLDEYVQETDWINW